MLFEVRSCGMLMEVELCTGVSEVGRMGAWEAGYGC